MSATNYAVMKWLADAEMTLNDNNNASFATGANAQKQGLRAIGTGFRVVKSVGTGAVILPSGIDAPPFMAIVNDSPNSINVGADAGEKVNGTLTTSSFGAGVVAVAAGTTGICVRNDSPLGIGGVATVSPLDWRVVVLA